MTRHLTIGILVLAAFATVPVAQQAPQPKAQYLLYHGASKVGWLRSERGTVESAGAKHHRELDTLHMVIRRNLDGQRFEVNGTSDTRSTSEGELVSTALTMTSGQQVITRTATVEGDAVAFSIVIDGGEPQRLQRPLDSRKPLTSRGAWSRLTAAGPPKAGQSITFPSVSLESFSIQEEVWTVRGAVTRQSRQGKPLSGTEIVSLKDGVATRAVLDDRGDPLFATIAGGFELESVDAIPDKFEADFVELESAMSSPVVVPDWRGLAAMEVMVSLERADESPEPLFETNPYHEVEKLAGGMGYRLSLKERRIPADIAAPSLPMADLPAEVRKFLAPTAMCQSDDPEILKKAREVVGETADSRAAATRLMQWVSGHLKPVSGDTGQASARQAFHEGKGDCTEHAALLVAMARAAGIPARTCTGIVYLSIDDAGVFGYHAWAELWLGSWVPVDSTVKELGTSARYIHLEIDEPGETRGAGRFARCLAHGIRPRITAYTWRQRDEAAE